MTSYDPNRRLAVRRRTLSLPSRRHHLSLALIALIILVATPVIFAKFFGQDGDAQPRGSVSVASIPDSDLPSPLDARSDTLPDLLSGSVAEGENPTDTLAAIDALGNPMSEKPAPSPRAAVRQPTQPKVPPLDPSVTRQSDFGLIPGPNDAGRTPLEVYQNTPPSTTTRVPVSVIVGGLGINGPLTQRAIDELPAAVTLSFAAQSPSLQRWIDRARARGHEVLLEIPMQGESFASSGPGTERTLRTSLSPAENRRHLHYLLSRGQGYAGVINYQGDELLRRSDVTGPILTELKASGLGLFIDGSIDAPTVGALAQSISLPFKAGFGLIDPEADLVIINAQLDALTNTAKENPGAVGVGFVYPQTINAVKGWAATLSAQGLVLVPATSSLK